ncbi:hypothetical protein FB45DRAFT_879491 [Roridomyces roridus]|uniref:Uncharacterized protein n=1 Tax=Roridomyces roridus TaxID=1738132 RepID=A0AAD7AZJ9_9AGAR|nr:hypothetical protein FB45DRAFT_879491 [Roridomyces roridus]
MEQDSPLAPRTTAANKRRLETDSDDEDGRVAPTLIIPGQNAIQAVERYAERKKLRAEQTAEAILLLQDLDAVRDAKILVGIHQLSNQLGELVSAKAPYVVSSDLALNIAKYAAAIFNSSKISAYKGAGPVNMLLAILKKNRFDLPPGIENNPADWSKVVDATQEAFTQFRAKVKKLLRTSVGITRSNTEPAPAAEQQNIYELAQAMVAGTQCTVTIEFCARVALMRKVYLEHSGGKYWDKLDAHLAEIRKVAKGDARKIARYFSHSLIPNKILMHLSAFRHILDEDRRLHGVNDYDITDGDIPTLQQEVDDLIDAAALDKATSAAGTSNASTSTAGASSVATTSVTASNPVSAEAAQRAVQAVVAREAAAAAVASPASSAGDPRLGQ